MPDKKSRSRSVTPGAKGDITVGSGATSSAIVTVGTNGQVLTADSTQALGVAWSTISASQNWSLLNAGGTSLSGTSTTVSGISGKGTIMVAVRGASINSASNPTILVSINDSSSPTFYYTGFTVEPPAAYAKTIMYPNENWTGSGTGASIGQLSADAASTLNGGVMFFGCNTSGSKTFINLGGGSAAGSSSQGSFSGFGYTSLSATVTSVTVKTNNSTTFDAGTVYVFATA